MHSSMSTAYSHLSSKVGLGIVECPKILASAGMARKMETLTLTLFLDPDNCGVMPVLFLVIVGFYISTFSLKVSVSKEVMVQ